MDVLVLTISDRASRGEYEDRSGPAVAAVVCELFPDAHIEQKIVADEAEEIRACFASHLHCDVILTTGGTGLSPRDITPEVTMAFCDRLIPGIADMLRSESRTQTPHAVLSRGVAGQKGATMIINLPGSVRGAEFCVRLLGTVLEHAPRMMRGEGHG